ncbi:MAG: peptidoglycan DD-metalloendopeptidase family protein [Parcubacteria group bacterium]|nr:peptidoglycan DD-metalloendopeptidase family protein [Parcubacteria group bacterium]
MKTQIAQKESEIKELETKANNYKITIEKTKKEKNTLANRLKILENEINKLLVEISITQKKIAEKKLRIEELIFGINSRQNEIEKQQESLTAALQSIYEGDSEPYFVKFLKNKNISGFFNQIEYLVLFQSDISQELSALKALKEDLETKKDSEAQKQQELGELEEELEGKKEAMDLEKNNKKDLLKITQKKESKYQNLLAEVQKKREEIQKEIFDLEDKLRLTIDPASLPQPRAGFLLKPTVGRLSQTYGPTSLTGFTNHAYKFHNGIDIAGDTGQPIFAADDGQIIAIGNNGNYAYGRWIAIDHGNNLITLYAHLSSIKKNPGQTVKRGEFIGLMGSTGFSTGSHLHFSLFAGNTFRVEERSFGSLPIGGSIDPNNYL